ncbi:unnamed protein product [Bemisia tabaci]|uniref:ATP-dependent RNA helicase n=1 Tax=Bemisia tabaci TaxID=7038 RepID=A0A9P0A3W7_BEMTA|nr:unnamed protein product [Bemisia tabaci]
MAEAETVGDYTIIKDLQFEGKSKVKRVLPEWLAKPKVVSIDLQNLSTKITDIKDLHPVLVKRLEKNKITHFFPIQAQLIPWIIKARKAPRYLWPCDICVSSPTGSGKTLAFAIPIIQLLLDRLIPKVRALVVLPTQDLAAQVYEVFKDYVAGTPLKVALISGGSTSLKKEQATLVRQCPINGLESLVDIVVTTPGRLLDHLDSTPGFTLSALEFLVIDEADRILDDFRMEWLQHLERHLTKGALAAPPVSLHLLKTLPPRPQRLLFSATLSQDPEKLQQLGLFQPKLFTAAIDADVGSSNQDSTVFVGKFTTPKELTEKYVQCTVASKPLFLYHFLVTEKWSQVLCFVHSVEMSHTLAMLLQHLSKLDNKPLNVAEISVERDVKNRLKIIKDFEEGKIDVLVTSDRLARGISIPNAKYVISFDVPKFAKNYIHRIGRTGRAGQLGTAVTLVSGKEVSRFQDVLKATKKTGSVSSLPFSRRSLHQYEDIFKQALTLIKSNKEDVVKRNLEKVKSAKKSKRPEKSKSGKLVHRKDIRRKGAESTKNRSIPNGDVIEQDIPKSTSENLLSNSEKTKSVENSIVIKSKKTKQVKSEDSVKLKTAINGKKVNGQLNKDLIKLQLPAEIPKSGVAKRQFIKETMKAKWQARKVNRVKAKQRLESKEKKKQKKKLKKKLKRKDGAVNEVEGSKEKKSTDKVKVKKSKKLKEIM